MGNMSLNHHDNSFKEKIKLRQIPIKKNKILDTFIE